MSTLCWGYNTNGLAFHSFDAACALLRALGYEAVGLTLDYGLLNPRSRTWREDAWQVRNTLARYGLRCVVETGARFLLDPWRKHQPTLLDRFRSRRQRRLRFLKHAVELAAFLRAEAVSFWSGAAEPGERREVLWARLCEACTELTHYAAERRVRLAFEPEPGMFIQRMHEFRQLKQMISSRWFGLTLDIGHVHCLSDGDPAQVIREFADCLYNVHIEDMRRGVHEHLVPGEGEIDFAPVVDALQRVGYCYGVYVELSRDSHRAVDVAKAALRALRGLSRTARRG